MTTRTNAMTNQKKTAPAPQSGTRRKAKLALAFLGAAALGGCGDTINNYYPCPRADGGSYSDTLPAKADSGTKPDSLKADSHKAEACKTAKPQCSQTSYYGNIAQGEALVVGNLKIQLDDLEVHGTATNAILSVLDSCGTLLMRVKVAQGSTINLMVDGQQVDVTAKQLAPGYTFGAKWAELVIDLPCKATYWCPAVSGVLNQGESLVVDNLKFQLDDLMMQNGIPYALMSVLDANNNVIGKEKIAEGTSLEKSVGGKTYLVTAKTVAPGYTFGAKWANIEISSQKDTPCGN